MQLPSDLDKAWISFFRDPSAWWDNRGKQWSSTYPDFKHVITGQRLWIKSSPPWVERQLILLDHETSQGSKLSATLLLEELKKCRSRRDLDKGKLLHANAVQSGCHRNVFVSSALISMYSRCGDVLQARRVFDEMTQRTAVTWNVLIFGYVENGECSRALEVFRSMNCSPNSVSLVAALKACAGLATGNGSDKESSLRQGVEIHRTVKQLGFDGDVVVSTALVDMYSKCGDMQRAQSVFDQIKLRSVVSWTALIVGYVENGESLTALDVFNSMDCSPDHFALAAALKASTVLASGNRVEKVTCMDMARSVHRQAGELGFEKELVVASTLVDLYSKLGDMQQARSVFDGMDVRNAVVWTALIVGYVDNGNSSAALEVFSRMDCTPDCVTYIAALKACAGLARENRMERETCVREGMKIHRRARENGFDKDIVVASTLVDMYSKCGDMVRARSVFDGMINRNVVSWTALIDGYVENGQCSLALDMFNRMDCARNSVTFAAALKACGGLGAVAAGETIHSQVCELGMEEDHLVATCLVDFYSKCGNMDAAESVFNRMLAQDIVAWTALMGGYSSLGDTPRVFSLVKRMQGSGVRLNGVAMQLILTTCSHAGLVEEGLRYFGSMSKYGLKPTPEHYGCVIDMLGRANRLDEALSLVRRMPFPANSVIWTSLLGACWKWRDLEVGKVAFDALVALNEDRESVATAHVLMRNVYLSLGLLHEAEQVQAWMETSRGKQKTGRDELRVCMFRS